MANQVTKIENMIYEIRGQKVMLDSDLVRLYSVELRSLNQAVKRNFDRFPSDFMFQLTDEEWKNQRSHFVIFIISEHDEIINQIIIAMNNLIEKPPKTKTIGFRTD